LFNKNYIYIDTLDSTNEFALSLKGMPFFSEGLVIGADYQLKGKGQVGRRWYSEKSMNILCSIIIEPKISLKQHFDISKIVSLSLYDSLLALGLSPKIKWPNDILINNKKIAGILIQNIVVNNIISYSVIGIGFNVNQHNFPKFSMPATSLSLELCEQQECVHIRDQILSSLTNRIRSYRKGDNLDLDYQEALFLKDKTACLETEKKQFKGIVRKVNEDGLLEVEINKKIKKFRTQEIRFLF